MDLKDIKFGIYARKSETGEDRQVMSIESQIDEMKKLQDQNDLNVVKVYTDAQTAHKPNSRHSFIEMLEDLHNGIIDGLLVWKADRLARNPIEGGSILYALQNETLKAIKTPYNTYIPTDNTLPLTIEFGMANQFSLDLSRNVLRGNKRKIKEGGHCGVAPCGYINDKEEKTILIDPERFDYVRRMWDLLLSGNYSVAQICKKADKEWGFKTIKRKKSGGGKIASSSLYRIFTNSFYCGKVKSGNNMNWGAHVPMITETEFEKAQEILRRRGRKAVTSYEFPFTGHIKCGDCGGGITAEEKVKYACPSCRKQLSAKNPKPCLRCKHQITKDDIAGGNWYIYYRCTKKKGKCNQKCVRSEELEGQFVNLLNSLEVDEEFEVWASSWLKVINENEFLQKKKENNAFLVAYQSAEDRLKNLIDMRAGNELTKAQFLERMKNAEQSRDECRSRLDKAEKRNKEWINRATEELEFIKGVSKRFDKGGVKDKKYIFSKIGSNFILNSGNLFMELKKEYLLIKETKECAEVWIEPSKTAYKHYAQAKEGSALNTTYPTWLGRRDSNPRSRDQNPLPYHLATPH